MRLLQMPGEMVLDVAGARDVHCWVGRGRVIAVMVYGICL